MIRYYTSYKVINNKVNKHHEIELVSIVLDFMSACYLIWTSSNIYSCRSKYDENRTEWFSFLCALYLHLRLWCSF